jgi:hypothetical protein
MSTVVAARLLGLSHRSVLGLIDAGELEAQVDRPTGPTGRRVIRLRPTAIVDFLGRARVKPGDLRSLYPPPAGARSPKERASARQ